MSNPFYEYTNVPKCCEAKHHGFKCLPCKKACIAWRVIRDLENNYEEPLPYREAWPSQVAAEFILRLESILEVEDSNFDSRMEVARRRKEAFEEMDQPGIPMSFQEALAAISLLGIWREEDAPTYLESALARYDRSADLFLEGQYIGLAGKHRTNAIVVHPLRYGLRMEVYTACSEAEEVCSEKTLGIFRPLD